MPPLLTSSSPALPLPAALYRARFRVTASAEVGATGRAPAAPTKDFPPFLPRAVEQIRDRAAVRLARRIERVPVQTSFSKSPIQSSCVRPLKQQEGGEPVVLLHGFDSSCLEWRYTYPLLEEAGLEAWAVDVLGWGFSDLEARPPCDVASKREHLYQFWRSYIKRPMVLVGPSLGAAVAIDFAVNYPDAVSKLIFIGASVYAEGTRDMTRVPKFVPYAGVFVLKSLPLRLFATRLAFNTVPDGFFDWVQIGRLHCLLPWWEDATVNFMVTGGYNVLNQIKQGVVCLYQLLLSSLLHLSFLDRGREHLLLIQEIYPGQLGYPQLTLLDTSEKFLVRPQSFVTLVKQKCLIIWGEDDGIISNKESYRLQQELPSAILRQVGQCGHIPHVEKPREAAKHVLDFLVSDQMEKADQATSLSSTWTSTLRTQ